MPSASPEPFDLLTTYVHLTDGPAASAVPVGPDFWARIAERTDLHRGRLVTFFRMTEDWTHWEMHPEGDELVALLSGAMDLFLEEPGGRRKVELRGRAAIVIPRGVWHWARAVAPSELLAVTRGEGTQTLPA